MANYPSDPGHSRRRPPPRGPSAHSDNRWLPPLDDDQHNGHGYDRGRDDGYDDRRRDYDDRHGGPAGAEKITVTRAAAQRSREMGTKVYGFVHRAATADGADKSGLTALTWPVVANNALDAAMGVALANTLFFAAASGESKSKVALYLLITIAPFAVIAPLIGPALGLPGRATGGPVSAGRAYRVGERGPEYFVPTSSGRIVRRSTTSTRMSSLARASATWSACVTSLP